MEGEEAHNWVHLLRIFGYSMGRRWPVKRCSATWLTAPHVCRVIVCKLCSMPRLDRCKDLEAQNRKSSDDQGLYGAKGVYVGKTRKSTLQISIGAPGPISNTDQANTDQAWGRHLDLFYFTRLSHCSSLGLSGCSSQLDFCSADLKPFFSDLWPMMEEPLTLLTFLHPASNWTIHRSALTSIESFGACNPH